MDDLTPLEPEYREIPPEQPPQIPFYYGTGIQTPPKGSRLPLILTILTVLMAINLIIVAVFLFTDSESSHKNTAQNNDLQQLESDLDSLLLTDDPQKIDDSGSLSLRGIYDHYAPGTVIVMMQTDHGLYCSTGMVLTQDGYLLAEAQIAGMDGRLCVRLHDGDVCEAMFIGMDEACDMAILKIDRQELATVTLSEEDALRTQQLLDKLLQQAATPATLHMDISEISEPMRIYWSLPEGVFIDRMATGSNAYLAGLRPGDVLLQIGGYEINNIGDYLEALNRYSAGDTVRIYLYRKGITYYTDVCLDAEGEGY